MKDLVLETFGGGLKAPVSLGLLARYTLPFWGFLAFAMSSSFPVSPLCGWTVSLETASGRRMEIERATGGGVSGRVEATGLFVGDSVRGDGIIRLAALGFCCSKGRRVESSAALR